MPSTTRIGGAGEFLKRAIDLRRYENQIARGVRSVLVEVRDELVGLLAQYDPAGTSRTYRIVRMRELLEQVRGTLEQGYEMIAQGTEEALLGVGRAQVSYTVKALKQDTGMVVNDLQSVGVGENLLRSIVTEDPIRGDVMQDWWDSQRQRTQDAFRRQVQVGVYEGETTDQLVRRVRGRSVGRGRYKGGIMDVSTKQAEALVRTAVNHVTTKSTHLTLFANQHLMSGYRWVSTLDRRTSQICMALDGTIFRFDDPNARVPPAHWNCRSTIVGVIDWKRLGMPPPPEGTRASEGGPVPEGWTYEQWLRDQPIELQDEILGPGRAKLFRAKKISLRDLVNRDDQSLTLKELEKRYG